MRKNIKYSVSFIIIILLAIFGTLVYAEDGVVSGHGEVKIEVKDLKENKIKLGEFRDDSEKGEIKRIREENKVQIEEMIQGVKEKREEFKAELKIKREEAKTRIETMRVSFKEDLEKIKDENKKISAEKIVDAIEALNIRLTDQLSDKVNQIENVLVSIESRIAKAESRGLDVTSVKAEVEKAKIAIASARTSISNQASKVYEVNVTSESTLRAEMKILRDTFNKDIKAVREKVKDAHVAVRVTATTLAKIPNIDEEVEEDAEVEVNSATNSN